MVNLHWELSVLSRAVAYPNLSGAASHVGLSQPQLSRIVSKLERELQAQFLDRTARRKSGWTAAAFKMAEIYSNSERKLEGEIQKLVKLTEPTQIRIATLEGLSSIAAQFCNHVLRSTSVSVARLDIYDLNALEELFLSGEMDAIFTFREPSRRKFKYSKGLGYQTLDQTAGPSSEKRKSIQVYSSFEYGTKLGHKDEHTEKYFVSNSLDLRKTWIRQFGGHGIVPSELKKARPAQGGHEVLLIGADTLSEQFWDQLSAYILKTP